MPRVVHFGLALIALLTFQLTVRADDQERNGDPEKVTIDDVFGRFGFTKGTTSSYSPCRVHFEIEQKKFVEAIPALQKIGLLNQELTQAFINKSPNSLTMVFMIEVLPTAVKNTYENHTNIDRCQFEQYITRVDDYGNNKRELSATFVFSRALYQKINWDNFDATKFPKVALGFRFTPSLMQSVNEEQ